MITKLRTITSSEQKKSHGVGKLEEKRAGKRYRASDIRISCYLCRDFWSRPVSAAQQTFEGPGHLRWYSFRVHKQRFKKLPRYKKCIMEDNQLLWKLPYEETIRCYKTDLMLPKLVNLASFSHRCSSKKLFWKTFATSGHSVCITLMNLEPFWILFCRTSAEHWQHP